MDELVWARKPKGFVPARVMADNHYTRQSPGHPMWTRPGYNHVLYAEFDQGKALWCWWRPKWEDGRPGTTRKDKLRAIECTMFRCEGKTPLASTLIAAAVQSLQSQEAMSDLWLHNAGRVDLLITGVNASKTNRRRARTSLPGACYRHAGWLPLDKRTSRAATWLHLPWSNPHQQVAEPQLTLWE